MTDLGERGQAQVPAGKRLLLLAIVASLSATALLAIGILLFGDFGETEGRILGTTALLAGFGLLSLPAGFLFDQRRLPALAAALLALSVGGFALAVAAVWSSQPPDELGKSLGTLTAFAVAATQSAALAARSRAHDPPAVRRLFALSCGLAFVLAGMVAFAVWAELDEQPFFRALGAIAVLDLLVVALQPILALTRPIGSVHHLRVLVEPDDALETTVEAPDFATAAAKAIRALERDGRRVVRLERREPPAAS